AARSSRAGSRETAPSTSASSPPPSSVSAPSLSRRTSPSKGGAVRLGPAVVRPLALGTGFGLSLLLLAGMVPRGLWSGVVALVSLVPMALAVSVGGRLVAVVAGLVAVAGTVALLGGGAAVALGLREGLPGLVLGVALVRRLSLPMTLVLVAAVSLLGLVVLLWIAAPPGTSPVTYLGAPIHAPGEALGPSPARLGQCGD